MAKLLRMTRKASPRAVGLAPVAAADHVERVSDGDCALPRDESHVNHAKSPGHPSSSSAERLCHYLVMDFHLTSSRNSVDFC